MRGIDGKAMCPANSGRCSREQEEICEVNPDQRCANYKALECIYKSRE